MRLRIDPVSASQIEGVARREGRTGADALRILVAAGMKARGGNAIQDQYDPWIDLDVIRRDHKISAHVPGPIRAAVEDVARREGRSLSAMLKTLLREALKARGVDLPLHGNDPARAERINVQN